MKQLPRPPRGRSAAPGELNLVRGPSLKAFGPWAAALKLARDSMGIEEPEVIDLGDAQVVEEGPRALPPPEGPC